MSGIFKVTARVQGTDQFDRIADAARDGMEDGLKMLAEMVRDEAKASTAFKDRSGKLRRSIRTHQDKDTGIWYVRAGGDGNAYHAHLVEFGHDLIDADGFKYGTVRGHPFLGPAAEKILGRAEEVVEQMIGGRMQMVEVKIK